MPTFAITGPDGKKYRVSGEDPAGAMQALRKMIDGVALPSDPSRHREFDASGIPGYDPETGMVKKSDRGSAIRQGFADTATFGFGDELASTLVSGIESLPGRSGKSREEILKDMRGSQASAQEEHPADYMVGQGIGAVGGGMLAAPLTASARVAGSKLLPRVAAGAADAAVAGGLYGAGSGETAKERLVEGATGAGVGAALGTAFPLVAAGAGKLYQTGRDMLAAAPIAKQAGAKPETLRMLGNVLDSDGTLGPRGQANMARAGEDVMLADAGPNAKAVLDTAIQRGGPGAVVARERIGERVSKGSKALTGALDETMGKPGVNLPRKGGDEAEALGLIYKQAYETPIDYSAPLARGIETMVKTRVPPSAIKAANELMRVEGQSSKQILAHLADDGSVVFETLPDVRQLDYITRGLNEVAEQADGQGKLGGTTATGRAYANLSREIRTRLKKLVPEYEKALNLASTEIRKKKASDFGAKILSPSVTRDQVKEFAEDMTGAERNALTQGIRSQIDDAMARVTRTVQDGDIDAREAIKALKDLSSRANREKLATAIGAKKAKGLFQEMDRIITSFDLRASVAENSKTYARQAMDRRISDMTEPGVIGKAAQGEPVNALKRAVQAVTGQTPERIRGNQDAIYSEVAELLTRPGGAGKGTYDAIDKLGKTDVATKLIADRIARALNGPRVSYPATTLLTDRTQR